MIVHHSSSIFLYIVTYIFVHRGDARAPGGHLIVDINDAIYLAVNIL